eukprot:1549780-Rhodomonas_salina.1
MGLWTKRGIEPNGALRQWGIDDAHAWPGRNGSTNGTLASSPTSPWSCPRGSASTPSQPQTLDPRP